MHGHWINTERGKSIFLETSDQDVFETSAGDIGVSRIVRASLARVLLGSVWGDCVYASDHRQV